MISSGPEDASYIIQLGDSNYYTSVTLEMSKSYDEEEQEYVRQAVLSYDTIYFTNLLAKANTFFPTEYDLSTTEMELDYGDAAQIYQNNYQIFSVDYWTGNSDTYYYFYLDDSSKPYEDYDGEAYMSYSFNIASSNKIEKYTYTIRYIPEHEEEVFNPITGEPEMVTVPENYIQTFVKNGVDTTGMQVTSNLVTSISSQSTDAQYPSAKCVYDIVGNIETLLQGV